MKREILFRGKRVDNGEWVEGNFFYLRKRQKLIPVIGDGVQNGSVVGFEVDIETVGQYINRNCAKTGEKIFEGMEVEFCEPGSIYAADKNVKNGVVKFADCSFYIQTKMGARFYRWMDYEVTIKKTQHA